MPRVSVILTSFNHEKFIAEAIESVLGQTFTDFDLIIWDDASRDTSWEIIKRYTDPRIRVFRNEINRRAIYGINQAISQVATGEYVAIHHSDDAWEPRKLEEQVNHLEQHPQDGAVFTNATIVGERGEPFANRAHIYYAIFDQPNRSRHEWLNYFFYHGNALCHPSVLLRRSCFAKCGLYRYGFSQVTDFDMWVRLCLKFEIRVLPEKLVRFRLLNNMANTSVGGSDSRVRTLFERFQILNNYRAVSEYGEMLKIFPAAEKYDRPEGFDAGYALAMMALEAAPLKYNELFGLQLLFEALNDPPRAETIKRLYDFDVNTFRQLTGERDVFSFAQVAKVKAGTQTARPGGQDSVPEPSIARLLPAESSVDEVTARLEEERQALTLQLADKDRTLGEIQNSRAWRLVQILRGFRLKLIPRDSFWERIWYAILRPFAPR